MSEQLTVRRSELIVPDAENTRKSMDPKRLQELGRSIKQSGLLSPVLVHRTEEGLKLVAGFRRVAAADAVLEGDFELPYVIVAEDSLITNIVENVQREDINPVDEAYGYLELTRRGLTPKGIAQKVGVSQARVTLRLELLELPRDVVELMREEKLPISAVKALRKIAAASLHLAKACAELCAGKPEYAAVLAKEPNRVVGFVASENPDQFFWTNGRTTYAQVRDLLTEPHRKFCDDAYAHAHDESLFYRLADTNPALTEGYHGEKSTVLSYVEHRETIAAVVNGEVFERMQSAAIEASKNVQRVRVEDIPEDASDAEVGAAARAEFKRKEAERIKREAELKERADAHAANVSLGAILKLETAVFSNSTDELDAVTHALLDWAPLGRLGGTWILVDTNCQTEQKGKVSYEPSSQGDRAERVKDFVLGGSTAPERLGRFIAVMAANAFADPNAVAMSQRPSYEIDPQAAEHLFELLDGMPDALSRRYLAMTKRPELEQRPQAEE